MIFQSVGKLVAFVFIAAAAFAGFSCKQAEAPGNQTANAGNRETIKASSPTEAYKMLFAAVRAKDTDKIRQMLSKNSMALAGSAAMQFNHTIEKQLENGMLETTITDTLPEIRDERVKDNYGAVEVYNKKASRWDETFFVNEDGGWKLAVGDAFNGSYKSPGKGRAQLEAEASNSAGDNMIPGMPNTNGKPSASGNVKTIEVPVEDSTKKPPGFNKTKEKKND
ncbi:MAG TPA: hypothetical protein VNI84_10735 [Pyrinomonadaceae bacterium]|nr:hypothetical protein [Pyrinomonadaceae bacterium]